MKRFILKASWWITLLSICSIVVFAQAPQKASANENVKKTQQLLSELGYPAGTPDGLFGKKTESALKQYQKDNDLPQTGMIDQATAKALGVEVYTPKKREKYEPINPRELLCTVKFAKFSLLSTGKKQEIVGTVKQLKCEGQEIELKDPVLKNQFVETRKYGKFKINLHPRATAFNMAINVSVTPSQKKQLLKLKSTHKK